MNVEGPLQPKPYKKSRVLQAFLFKRLFPVEIAITISITIFFINLLSPQIFAMTLPAPLSSPTPLLAEVSEIEVLTAYVDDVIYKENYSYASAIRMDAERDFYVDLVNGNQRIVEAVYTYAKDLNKDLIFALILQESGGDPKAYNENVSKATGDVTSVDRGVFQLNSNSYPNLTVADFYNIETNVRYGIGHLRGELEYWDGNIKKSLWTYNAGRNGISDGVPARTVSYAQSIILSTKAIKAEKEWYIKQSLIKYQPTTLVATLLNKE